MSSLLGEPTKVFYNARLITLDRRKPRAEGMAIADGKILAIGSSEEMLALASAATELEDLAGQVVLPGFNDSHMHLLNWGLGLDGADLTSVRSPAELVQVGQEFARNHPEKKWVIGRGWNDHTFSDKKPPTKTDLDAISRERPVVLTRVCGHVCAVNSLALKMGEITAYTADPPGGSIDRHPQTREPSGILRERAMSLVKRLIPEPTVTDLKRVLKKAGQAGAALGLTSIQSNDLQGASSLQTTLQAYIQLAFGDELVPRVNLQASMPNASDLSAYLEVWQERADLGPNLKLGPLKLFVDGSLGARTAALTDPYADEPDNRGITLYDQEELDELILLAAQANLQTAVHAIGDRALDLVITSYERAKQSVPHWTARPRIIHCQIARADQLEKMAALGIAADIQPIFLGTDLHFVEQRVGAENFKYAYAWKTMQKMGIRTGGGSDCPVENCNPLWGLHAAVTRQDRQDFPPEGWQPQERLTVREALELFTLGSAYVAHEEEIKGSLSPGKLADFVLLSEDPEEVFPEQLSQIRIEGSFIGGCRV